MIRTVSRRLSRLEERAALEKTDRSVSIRIRLVHPEEGCTGVLLFEPGQQVLEVSQTPEDIEEIGANVETASSGSSAVDRRHRAAAQREHTSKNVPSQSRSRKDGPILRNNR